MNSISFSKFHGTGNDFVIIDCREKKINLLQKQIEFICNRHIGIGADGLILIYNDSSYDFRMQYFNSDGYESSMCGNGGRSIVAYAYKNKIINKKCKFVAIDGIHYAEVTKKSFHNYYIKISMNDVTDIYDYKDYFLLNTGSPHYVSFSDNINKIDVKKRGREIRFNKSISEEGLNVNFVKIIQNNEIYVRTYERGVEDETLSCGTGVVASALAYAKNTNINKINISTNGGNLQVSFKKTGNIFTNIFLIGPATFVFDGTINL